MRTLLAVLKVLAVLVYPLAVYAGLTRFGARGIGVVIAIFVLPSAVLKLAKAEPAERWAVLKMPLAILALIGAAAALDDPRFVFALPVLINTVLLWSFGRSLSETPMVERFARMQEDTLSDAQVGYCRTVTLVWCVFFALNAMVTALLAWWGDARWWALHTGLLAYVAIGTLAAIEYVVRKSRFRDYGTGLHDRFLARIFPPAESADR